MKPYIWESSIFRTRTPQIQSLRIRKHSANYSIQKTNTSKTKDYPFDSPTHPNSFLFSKSRLSNHQNAGDLEPLVPSTEDFKDSKQSIGFIERILSDKEEVEIMKEDKSLFVVHTYARPRRLVAVKDRHYVKDPQSDSRKILNSPTVRLGISGWKLSKPRSVTPSGLSTKSIGRKKNFLQIISTKL